MQPAETTGQESVTLVNAGDRTVDLDGWSLANKSKKKQRLSGTIEPGQFLTIGLVRSSGGQDFLANQGDLITLLDAAGLKVHGVSYTRSQVKPGWTVLF
ncbi:lamin tail domain-containing protein [Paenibacillus filicis]|uniref:Lamin tail domain-containing protein n=1 Tax=Paenibacillus gyeongsangnamensis TaxID=3388067 RepID=A0ABT4QG56_9BACL|nr:lamin tail domain-containing protein [Paenibacillus filicis]MCZ8515721.1 lamin tail domain-containing protein [Paenibacillus filicis]